MTKLIRKLSLLLCCLIAFTTIFTTTPAKAQTTTEDKLEIYSYIDFGVEGNLTVTYIGTPAFYIGDYLYTNYQDIVLEDSHYEDLDYVSNLKGVTYKSSNPKIASIDKNGKITAKKAGTTTITVTYEGVSISGDLRIVSKSNFYKELNKVKPNTNYKKNATSLDKKANSFLKKTGENPKLTKSNRYELVTVANHSEFSVKHEYASFGNNIRYTKHYLYSTANTHAFVARKRILSDAEKYNPFSTYSKNYFKVKSINGSGKNITITLKNKVSTDMIFGANCVFSWDSELKESKTYTFPIVVQNTTTNSKHYAIATVKKGDSKITVKLQNHKLRKGTTYKLLALTNNSSYNLAQHDTLGNWLYDQKNTFKSN